MSRAGEDDPTIPDAQEAPAMTEPAYDARQGTGDPETDPAAQGERSASEPDGDGGAVVDEEVVEGHPS